MSQPTPRPEVRVYDGIEFEVIPISNFVSSPLVTTTSELIAALITPEEEDHEDRVAQAKRARSFVRATRDTATGRYTTKS
jgi:hypothetical protein